MINRKEISIPMGATTSIKVEKDKLIIEFVFERKRLSWREKWMKLKRKVVRL